MYGALRRIELDGLLSSELMASKAGPARKYYGLTSEGRSARSDAMRAWGELVTAMQRIVRPSSAVPQGKGPSVLPQSTYAASTEH